MQEHGILYKRESYEIQGAVFEVYNQMGCGYLEAVYQECLERELAARGIPFEAQKDLSILYEGVPLAQTYKADLVCYRKIILELKAMQDITNVHRA